MTNRLRVRDDQDDIDFGFADVARYHGFDHLAGAAIGFKALQGAFDALSPSEAIPRRDVSVVTGHPGSGVRDAIELVTRAVTRGAYTVDPTLPKARLNPHKPLSFSFYVTVQDREVELALNEGVLPARFFDLMEIVGQPGTDPERAELRLLKRTLARRIIAQAPSELFGIEIGAGLYR